MLKEAFVMSLGFNKLFWEIAAQLLGRRQKHQVLASFQGKGFRVLNVLFFFYLQGLLNILS